MKNISQVILLSTSCLIGYGADNVCASVNVFSGIPKSGTHTHYTTHLAEPHLSSIQSNNRHRLPRKSAAISGDPGENMEALFDLDVRGEPEHDIRVASVCFITDTGACSGNKFGNGEDLNNGGNPEGGNPDYGDPEDLCRDAGFVNTPCPDGATPDSYCPYDSSWHSKCKCSDKYSQTCTPPYYGVGESCDGKYVSCERDDGKSCRDEGYTQTGACSSAQKTNAICPYDSAYYDKCVCRSDLVTCTSPLVGVGEACGGKYASCQCPSLYKSCDCGAEAGATSCTVNGNTKYSSCKECCNSSNPRWCSVHRTCHGDCCSNGAIEACDVLCGGSGCEPVCTPLPDETGCQYGTTTVGDGCGGVRIGCATCKRDFNSCPYSEVSSDCRGMDEEYVERCTDNCGKSWGECCKACSCRCNSASDCSNCPPTNSYYDARCTKTTSDGCGGYCPKWGRWEELESYTRNCINAAGDIVLSYTVYETFQQYTTQIYCDDVLTKSFGSLPADTVLLPLSPVVFPAEPVTCDRIFDFDDVTAAGNYVVTFDYNTKYCGGTAKSVTLKIIGIEKGRCK